MIFTLTTIHEKIFFKLIPDLLLHPQLHLFPSLTSSLQLSFLFHSALKRLVINPEGDPDLESMY